MTLVAVCALVFAALVVFAALAFVRWSFRALERKDRLIDRVRSESMERYARLVGQQLESTPRERAAENEHAVHQAQRELQMARVIEDPEQAIEYGSPQEARVAERMIFEELRARAGVDVPDEARWPEFIDIEVDAAR